MTRDELRDDLIERVRLAIVDAQPFPGATDYDLAVAVVNRLGLVDVEGALAASLPVLTAMENFIGRASVMESCEADVLAGVQAALARLRGEQP